LGIWAPHQCGRQPLPRLLFLVRCPGSWCRRQLGEIGPPLVEVFLVPFGFVSSVACVIVAACEKWHGLDTQVITCILRPREWTRSSRRLRIQAAGSCGASCSRETVSRSVNCARISR